MGPKKPQTDLIIKVDVDSRLCAIHQEMVHCSGERDKYFCYRRCFTKQFQKHAVIPTPCAPRVRFRIKKPQEFPISVENWLSLGTRYTQLISPCNFVLNESSIKQNFTLCVPFVHLVPEIKCDCCKSSSWIQ